MKQFGLVLNGTWCDGRRNPLMGNSLEEVSNLQKTNQRATNKNRKKVTMTSQLDWYQPCATTNFLQLLRPC